MIRHPATSNISYVVFDTTLGARMEVVTKGNYTTPYRRDEEDDGHFDTESKYSSKVRVLCQC